MGNSISETNINQENSETTQRPFFTAKNQVTAFDYNKWLKVIAYAEFSNPRVNFVKWPSGEECMQNYNFLHGMYYYASSWNPQANAPRSVSNDLYISSIQFSKDCKYLATLGTLPTYQICVFDVRFMLDVSSLDTYRKKPLLCVTTNNGPARSIRFDPLDSRVFYTVNERGDQDLSSDILGDEAPSDHDLDYYTKGIHGINMWRIDLSLKESKVLPMYLSPFYTVSVSDLLVHSS